MCWDGPYRGQILRLFNFLDFGGFRSWPSDLLIGEQAM